MDEITNDELTEILDVLGAIIDLDGGEAEIDVSILEGQTEEELTRDESLGTEEIW